MTVHDNREARAIREEERASIQRLDRRPLYAQVYFELADRIARGSWRPGDLIPNEVDLARELGVSVGTMRKALKMLEAKRVVIRHQGRGTFIADHSNSHGFHYQRIRTCDNVPIETDVKLLEMTVRTADRVSGPALHLNSDASVIVIRRVRSHNGHPICCERCFLPASLFPGLVEQGGPGARISPVAQKYGLLIGESVERINASAATSQEAALLQIEVGHPVLVLSRLIKTLDGQPIELRLAVANLNELDYVSELN
jgi:GntR family transcriptional regulator